MPVFINGLPSPILTEWFKTDFIVKLEDVICKILVATYRCLNVKSLK